MVSMEWTSSRVWQSGSLLIRRMSFVRRESARASEKVVSREGDPVLPVRLLNACDLEVLQDRGHEVRFLSVAVGGLSHAVDQLVVLIHAQYAVGRDALDSERLGDTDFLVVLVRLVI